MRGLILMTLCLGLAGCSMPNPSFELGGAGTGSSGADTSTTSTTATTATTGTTLATSDSSPTTSGASGDTGTSEPVTTTTTTGPATTQTSDPVDTSGQASSSGEPPTCELPPTNDNFMPYVFLEGAKYGDCAQPLIVKGMLNLGNPLEVLTDPNCGDMNNPTKLRLGDGYPMFPAQVFPACVTVIVNWKSNQMPCEMGHLWIAPNADINTPIVFATFSVPLDLGAPIQPKPVQSTYCGCPEGGDPEFCCPEVQPGALKLKPSDDSEAVAQSNHEPVPVDGLTYEFYNLESWAGPECADAFGAGRRIDWIAILKQ